MGRNRFTVVLPFAVAMLCMPSADASEKTSAAVSSNGNHETVFVESPVLLRTLVRLPDAYEPDDSHILVIGLHGFGSTPEQFISVGDRFARAGFLFAAPQAPNAFFADEGLGFGWDLTHLGGTRFDHRASELTIEYITTLVEKLKSRYTVSNVFLLGFSQGAAYSYVVGFFRPDLFSGLICFGFGFEPEWFPGNQLESATRLKVFIAHATDDQRVPIEDSKTARDKMVELGYDVTFLEYKGGHRLEPSALDASVNWLQKQTTSQRDSNR